MLKKNAKDKIIYSVALGSIKSPMVPYVFVGDIDENIEKARNCGYGAVELHIRNPKQIDIENILESSEKFNIKISAISTGLSYHFDKLCLINDSSNVREAAVLKIKDYIDLAAIIGGFIIIGTMRGSIPDKSLYSIYEKRLSESMKKISEYALLNNVMILIEGANRYEINYLNRAEEISNFIKKYNIPMLKIHLDTYHMNIEEVDISQSIRKFGELLGYFHVADSNRMYPGAGHIDFKSITSALKDIDYHGYVTVECLPIPDGDTAAKRALNYISAVFSQIEYQ